MSRPYETAFCFPENDDIALLTMEQLLKSDIDPSTLRFVSFLARQYINRTRKHVRCYGFIRLMDIERWYSDKVFSWIPETHTLYRGYVHEKPVDFIGAILFIQHRVRVRNKVRCRRFNAFIITMYCRNKKKAMASGMEMLRVSRHIRQDIALYTKVYRWKSL